MVRKLLRSPAPPAVPAGTAPGTHVMGATVAGRWFLPRWKFVGVITPPLKSKQGTLRYRGLFKPYYKTFKHAVITETK